MNGTDNEVFFKESKRTKRERFKWIVIVISTNLITLMLMLPASDVSPQQASQTAWPSSWVEMSFNAQIMATGTFPIAVTILDQNSKVIIKKAFLIESKNSCATFNSDQVSRFMIAPQDLSLISNHKQMRVLPFSNELILANSQAQPTYKRESYEIRF